MYHIDVSHNLHKSLNAEATKPVLISLHLRMTFHNAQLVGYQSSDKGRAYVPCINWCTVWYRRTSKFKLWQQYHLRGI